MDIDVAFDDAALLTSAAAMRALGHPIRLGIMRRLAAEPETCACDFTEVFGVAQPTISQHLKVLREAGLVRTRRRGTQICYSVDPLGLAVVTQAIATLTRPPVSMAG
jgi:ArsR family transcriptional regulator